MPTKIEGDYIMSRPIGAHQGLLKGPKAPNSTTVANTWACTMGRCIKVG